MSRGEEKLCLKWNDFQENIISAFGTLREDRDFADVTLVCEDGQQVETHKVILASSSPFFLNLLRKNKHPHPLIYMRGLKSEDLVAMIDFLYYGEANVYQNNLDAFLAVAEELQLKGLLGSATEKESHTKPPATKQDKKPLKQKSFAQQEVITPEIDSCVDKIETLPHLEGTMAVTDYTVATDAQDLDDKIKSMMIFSEIFAGGQSGRARICKVCGKEGKMNVIMQHIETHHIIGTSHTCTVCGNIFNSRSALAVHRSRKHRQN